MVAGGEDMRKNKICSIVVPCYNEEQSIQLFYYELNKTLSEIKELEFQIWFVDDGSKDGTLAIIKELQENDDRIHYITFSRNFGKEAAMLAGLENAQGDYVITMDVDLQDPPALIPEMYRIIKEEEYDCVATRRTTREGEPKIRSFFARRFYRIINKISDVDIVDGARDFRFMSRQMVDAIISLKEYNRFTKGIYGWVGFRVKWLEFENKERVSGETKWNFWKLFLYSLEGIMAFSTVPLAVASIMGVLLCLLAIIMIGLIFVRTIIFSDPVPGWPSLVCIIIFLGGVQLFCMGIIGMYLSKTYLETKRRPSYIMKEMK